MRAGVDEGDVFVVEIEDDGTGFDPAAKSVRTGRGLTNIRSRASMIGAEVAWERRETAGMTFTLRKRMADCE